MAVVGHIIFFILFVSIFQDTHQDVIATRKRKEEARKRKEELVSYNQSLCRISTYYRDQALLSPTTTTQEKQREMTLRRRRSRLQLEPGGPGSRQSVEFSDNAEFDELISLLKTGDFMAHRRSRQSSSTNLRTLEFSRERPSSTYIESSDA